MKIRTLIEGDKGAKENAKIAYNFFVQEKGYTPQVALGIVGNLMKESYTDIRPNAVGDNNTAYGVAQWRGDRLDNLKKIRPDDFNTLKGQLEFIDWELNNTEKRAWGKVKQSKTVEDATLAFSQHYERPHKDYADNDTRISHAIKLGNEVGYKTDIKKRDKKEVKTPEEGVYRVDYPERKINNTFVPANYATLPEIKVDNTFVPANYATLPEIKVEEEKPLTEQDLRKILEEEKSKNVKTQEDNFVNAFKQQTQSQQDLSTYQPQQQDLSHLYNYIQQGDDSFYTQGFADGGSLKSNCGGPGQPPCENEKVSKEEEASIFEYLNSLNTNKEVKPTDTYGSYKSLTTKTDKNNLKKDLEKDTLQTSSSLYVPPSNILGNIKIDENKISKENPLLEIKKEEQELNKAIEDRYNSITAKEDVNFKANLESELQQNNTSLYTPKKEKLNISNIDNQNKIVSYKRESEKGFNEVEAKKIQTKLQELGYDIGKYGVDGKIGKDTRDAVKQFQKDKGLKKDGVVGKNTVAALSGFTTSSIKEILKEEPIKSDFVSGFQRTMNTHFKDTPGNETGIWDKDTEKSFYDLKKMISEDTQSRFKPAISRSFSSLKGEGSNLTEKNFSSNEIEKMKKLAVKDGKLQSYFGYDDIREGTDLKGSGVSDIMSSVYENPSSLYNNKEEITLLLTLGQASIMEGPDGNVYVYDVYDFNDVGNISDGRSPEDVYNDRLDSKSIDMSRYESAPIKEQLKIRYEIKRAQASYEQRKQQLLSKEKGEKWKPTAALINLGKKSDLLGKAKS